MKIQSHFINFLVRVYPFENLFKIVVIFILNCIQSFPVGISTIFRFLHSFAFFNCCLDKIFKGIMIDCKRYCNWLAKS